MGRWFRILCKRAKYGARIMNWRTELEKTTELVVGDSIYYTDSDTHRKMYGKIRKIVPDQRNPDDDGDDEIYCLWSRYLNDIKTGVATDTNGFMHRKDCVKITEE